MCQTFSPEAKVWLSIDKEPKDNLNTDVDTESSIVPTIDTEITRKLVKMMFIGGKSLVLCGNNGVGKRTILEASHSSFQELKTVQLNFSKSSTINFALQTKEQFCLHIKIYAGIKLTPKAQNIH